MVLSLIDFLDRGKELRLSEDKLRVWAETEYNKYLANIEAETKRADAALEREMRLIERKIALANAEGKDSNNDSQSGPHSRYKFSSFDEKKEDINSFLNAFERQCTLYKLKEQSWPMYLMPLLSGTCRDVFFNLPQDSDYKAIKHALLAKFNQTKENYRRTFMSAKPTKDETLVVYINRLKQSFNKWIELSGIDKSYEELFNLIIKNRVFDSCNENFVSFVQERDPATVPELISLGEKFFSAHTDQCLVSKANEWPVVANKASFVDPNPRGRSHFRESRYDHRSQSADARSYSRPNSRYGNNTPFQRKQYVKQNLYDRQPDQYRQDYFRSRRCYKCGKTGHIQSSCPLFRDANHVLLNQTWERGMVPGDVVTLPGEAIQVSCNAQNDDLSNHIFPGYVFDKQIRVLRDSGANVHGVRKDIVPPHCFTGRKIKCVLFGGRVELFSEVSIFVDTPFFTGEIKACALDNSITELILGNGTDIRQPSKSEINTWINCRTTKPNVSADTAYHNFDSYHTIESPVDSSSQPSSEVSERKDFQIAAPIVADDDSTLRSNHHELNTIVIHPLTDILPSQPIHNNESDVDYNDRHTSTTSICEKNDCRAQSNEIIDPVHIETDVSNAVTRGQIQKLKENKCHNLSDTQIDFNLSPSEFAELQKNDVTLNKYYNLVSQDIADNKQSVKFVLKNGLLIRIFRDKYHVFEQLVVPLQLRSKILSLAHDMPFGAHMGTRRTQDRITADFYWPGISSDVKIYCRSCDVCQKTKPKGRTPRAPLQSNLPIISTPFQKCAIDIIGPISPASEAKNRYILTLIDFATRWVEAIPLRDITTTMVSEALLTIFSRIGLPAQVVSDNGPQFVSGLMQEVLTNLGIQHIKSSPYHPQANGLCERANGTIKSMIIKLAHSHPNDWDRYLPCILFSYREIPQETTQFSPFELVYGSNPRGPLNLIKDLWSSPSLEDDVRDTYAYVSDLKNRITDTCKIAAERTRKQSEKSKKHYDRLARPRSFQPGDLVMLFLPTDSNKIVNEWKGPFEVIKKISPVNYQIQMDNKQKTFHLNMLQQYHVRPKRLSVENCTNANIALCSVSFMCDSNKEADIEDITMPSLKQTESLHDVKINPELNSSQKREVSDLLDEFSSILTDIPGCTTIEKHKIDLLTDVPIKLKPYKLPFESEKVIDSEVKSLLDMGVIQPSTSPYSAPLVLVKKKDNSWRPCVDFRKLNQYCLGDASPINDPETLFAKLKTAKYFTKFDLAKGYFQIKMDEESIKYTAFATNSGLYEFVRMPFGLKNAPATFNRMMRKLFDGFDDVIFYFDDLNVFHDTWESHMFGIRRCLSILKNACLTIRPSKCEIAMTSISFLGHMVGHGTISPLPENVTKILQIAKPKTKKQVRSILGLVNYYAKFIPNLASVIAPISALLGKGMPDKIHWTDECERSVTFIQNKISCFPVLILPDFSSTFVVQTDASSVGIGAALLQERDHHLHPVTFVSRKLLPRECNYSVIELECLAIVWSFQKLSRYLLGKPFRLLSDHKPLSYLKSTRSVKGRLCRWALLLQEYDFTIHHIPGSANFFADFLSRNV